MDNSLRALLVVTGILVVAALGLTFARPTATGPTRPPPQKYDVVTELSREGGIEIQPKGSVQVRLESGTDAASAQLACGVFRMEREFKGGKLVFEEPPPEECAIQIAGTREAYGPVFAGDNLGCMAVDGATRCLGGIAASKPAILAVESEAGGTLHVDDVEYGPTPIPSVRLKPGRHEVEITLADGSTMREVLLVKAGERLLLRFPTPKGWVPPDPVAPTAGEAAPAPAAAPATGS